MLGGAPAHFTTPLAAQRAGIAVMHQHPGLFPELSVGENLFIGRPLAPGRLLIDYRERAAEAARLLKLVGLDCDPDLPLARLRTSEQQLVEIARALSQQAKVLIMDEPTAALSQREVDRLFTVVDDLRVHGVAMMFVGHRMDEVFHVADRIAVLRDGRLVGTERASELSRERAIQMMVGRTLAGVYPHREASHGPAVLSVRDLARDGAFRGVSFDLHAGEILGFGGLVGSGRTEIARVLFGIDRPTAGSIAIDGDAVDFHSARDAMARGIAYVSEDRLGQSLVMDFSILDNAALTVLDEAKSLGLVSRPKELALVEPHLERLRLRFGSYDQAVSTLSGGNQQKVIVAREFFHADRLLVLSQPTRGLDVGSIQYIHRQAVAKRDEGVGVLLNSSELDEVLALADRVAVIYRGRIVGVLDRAEASRARIGLLMAGAVEEAAEVEIPGEEEVTVT
jgi:ABC-type sugar transport system ATPase subunit